MRFLEWVFPWLWLRRLEDEIVTERVVSRDLQHRIEALESVVVDRPAADALAASAADEPADAGWRTTFEADARLTKRRAREERRA